MEVDAEMFDYRRAQYIIAFTIIPMLWDSYALASNRGVNWMAIAIPLYVGPILLGIFWYCFPERWQNEILIYLGIYVDPNRDQPLGGGRDAIRGGG